MVKTGALPVEGAQFLRKSQTGSTKTVADTLTKSYGASKLGRGMDSSSQGYNYPGKKAFAPHPSGYGTVHGIGGSIKTAQLEEAGPSILGRIAPFVDDIALFGPRMIQNQAYNKQQKRNQKKLKRPPSFGTPSIQNIKLAEMKKYAEVLVKIARASRFKSLQKNKVPLTDEERAEVMRRNAVWNHGPNGEESPAVWKSVDKKTGKTTYVTNTHRAYNERPTLAGAISRYHKFIKSTS
jgi:hypothetical protein